MAEAPLPPINNYSITSDKNNEYSLDISSDSNNTYLNVTITTKNKFPKNIYQENISYEIFRKNKYFSICESMSEALSAFYPIIKNINNIKLSEHNNELNLIVALPHPSCPKIVFNFKPTKKDVNDSISELYELINKLTKKIENQQNIIDQQNNKIRNLEEKINKIEEKEKKREEEKREEEELKKNLIKESKIIGDDIQKGKTIREWIDPNKKIQFNLLFRKSRDGSNCSDFHRCCDKKGATLTLIETDKGYKFGGYTPIEWESHNGLDKTDELTFLFSLNQMKKYTKIQNYRSIFLSKDYGPIFGYASDLYINKDMNKGNSDWGSGTFLKNGELTNGEHSFNVKEIEIFQVEFK